MVDKMLGMICLTIIISDFCPDTFAYKTYSRSFTDNVSALTIRAVSIHVSNPIIRTSVVIPGFKYAFNSSIKKNDGIDISTSTTRIKKLSNFPPKYPLIVPTAVPIVIETTIARKPTASETRPPYNALVK